MPHVEFLALYKSEEGAEESGIRQNLGLASIDQMDVTRRNNEDVAMEDTRPQPVAPHIQSRIPQASGENPIASTIPTSNQPQLNLPKPAPSPALQQPTNTQSPTNDPSLALEPPETSTDTLDEAISQPSLAQAAFDRAPETSLLKPQPSTSHIAPNVSERPVSAFSVVIDEDEDENDEVPSINPDSDSEGDED
jgi:hypothetical protein